MCYALFKLQLFENNFLTIKQSSKEDFFIVPAMTSDKSFTIPENSTNLDVPCQGDICSPIYDSEHVFINYERKLGKGSYGSVYESRIFGSNNVYAAKKIRVRHENAQTFHDVSKESEVQYKLAKNSDAFPKVICISFTKNSVIIVMEKIGITLLDAIYRKLNNEAEVKDCILQLLRGAKEMHEQKIAHMDIKPENIGITVNIDESLSFKYLDFSTDTICEIDENSMGLPHGGTPEYASPEAWRSCKTDNNIRCDLADTWSIGCTILQMITGIPPWQGISLGVFMRKLCNGNHPDVPSEIPDTVRDFILECFKNDDERLSPSELLTQYHDVLTH